MPTDKFRKLLGLMTAASMLFICTPASAEYFINSPDGRMLHLKEGTFQPDLSPYQSKLPEVKVLDRTFRFKEQDWAANEEFDFSQNGLANLVRAANPVAHNPAFIWLTNQQLYWNARNQLGFVLAAGHAGINMVNGPYWTLKAIELSQYSALSRDRGERFLSNKDVLLQYYFPLYWKITGMPRFPDDGSPSYLEFESADPHFVAPTPVADTFNDPQSGKNGKWGVPEYFFNNRMWRWDRDGMSKYLDMGGIGIMMKRASMWIDYMWKGTHTGISPSDQKKKVILQGTDAEEGFRGMALATTRINAVLALKTQLVADESGELGGINPVTYDPANGLRYFPHRIWPNMLMAGDLPERQWSFDIDDASSHLYDQGSLVWGTSHLFQSIHRMKTMFTANPPVDGGLMEKALAVVPHHLANMVIKNIVAMHTRDGLLVSEWNPSNTKWWDWTKYGKSGTGDTIRMVDMELTFIGLSEYIDRMQDPLVLAKTPDLDDLEPEMTKIANDLMTRNADFLLKVQGKDGSFCESYNVTTSAPAGPCDLSTPNFQAIGTLLATEDYKYHEAARKTWNYIWENYWSETHGVFRSRLGDDTVIITPLDIAAQLRAWRELLFKNPVHWNKPLIDKFPRYVVQTMMLSGMIMAEENRSGELALGIGAADWDNDGVPWLGKGHGEFGITPVLAGKVAINIGAPGQNQAFNALKGEKHEAEQFGGDIRYGYKALPKREAVAQMVLPVSIDFEAKVEDEGWVERGELLRWNGTIHTMPPSKPIKRGSPLKGEQIFQMNCAHCHGYTGEGITGISFESDSLARTRDDMFEVPKNGRFTRLMPEWGIGSSDEMESVLTDEEIYRVVDYVQSPGFQKRFVDTQKGFAYPNVPPKDPYFFISRSYNKGKKNSATEEDIALVMNTQMEAIRTGKPINVIQRLIDAERNGGAKGEIAKAEGWKSEDFASVTTYTNEEQVHYASKPVEFKDVETAESSETQTVEEAKVPESKDGLSQEMEKRSEIDLETNEAIRVAQTFDQDLFRKAVSYTQEDVRNRGQDPIETPTAEASEESEDPTSQDKKPKSGGEKEVSSAKDQGSSNKNDPPGLAK